MAQMICHRHAYAQQRQQNLASYLGKMIGASTFSRPYSTRSVPFASIPSNHRFVHSSPKGTQYSIPMPPSRNTRIYSSATTLARPNPFTRSMLETRPMSISMAQQHLQQYQTNCSFASHRNSLLTSWLRRKIQTCSKSKSALQNTVLKITLDEQIKRAPQQEGVPEGNEHGNKTHIENDCAS